MSIERPLILALFNSSPYAVMPWLEDGGFDVVSVDHTSTDHSRAQSAWEHSRHRHLDLDLEPQGAYARLVNALEGRRPALVLSFPPCTDLAVSGARHFRQKLARDPDCQLRAVRMATLGALWGCPYIIENPVSVLSTLWRAPDYYWDPCDYAGYCPEGPHPEFPDVIPENDRYKKRTGAWIGHGFIRPEPLWQFPAGQSNPGWARLGGKSARTKYIRSLTPRGWAQAVYEANHKSLISED